jgi:hypothetical protein
LKPGGPGEKEPTFLERLSAFQKHQKAVSGFRGLCEDPGRIQLVHRHVGITLLIRAEKADKKI